MDLETISHSNQTISTSHSTHACIRSLFILDPNVSNGLFHFLGSSISTKQPNSTKSKFVKWMTFSPPNFEWIAPRWWSLMNIFTKLSFSDYLKHHNHAILGIKNGSMQNCCSQNSASQQDHFCEHLVGHKLTKIHPILRSRAKCSRVKYTI